MSLSLIAPSSAATSQTVPKLDREWFSTLAAANFSKPALSS